MIRRDVETVRESGFYAQKEWIEVRDFVRQRDKMICARCGEPITDGSPHVDHIIPLSWENVDNWEIAFNPKNLQLMHRECHTKKTREDKRNASRLFY